MIRMTPSVLVFLTFIGLAMAQTTPSTSFCFGDGSVGACPCNNNGAAGRGCGNPSFPNGALLINGGVSSISADTMTLTAIDITGPAIIFQSDGVAASPIPFGHGLFCAAVGIRRLGTVFRAANMGTYPGGLTPDLIHIAGGPIAAGDTKHYQCWYREIGTPCLPFSNSGFTQALTVTWTQ